ncbi:RNase P subunit p30-domain-containing protein [Pilaira anomala]|nr:RNase P subunit p30-domain-containing protein [Pilaira anomala]
MFYDFNIPYPNTSDASDLERIETILSRIQSFDSHSIVALNLSTDTLMNVKKSIQPIAIEKFKNMRQLTRATLLIEDPKRNYQLAASSSYPHIDILAVRPTTIEVCKHACQTLEIDMISLDLATTKVSPGFVSAQVALSRGVFFEICYSQTFRNPSKKSAFFNAVKRLVEITRGRNLIFSSEAIRALDIKRVSDIRILGTMFGMTQDQIETSLSVNYTRLLKKSETRRMTYNAAIGIDIQPTIQEKPNLKRKKEEQPSQNNRSKKIKK